MMDSGETHKLSVRINDDGMMFVSCNEYKSDENDPVCYGCLLAIRKLFEDLINNTKEPR